MLELNESNFESNVKNGIVLVDFYSETCGPCKALTPVLHQLNNIKIFKVNVVENSDLSLKHKVSAVPTLLFFKDGAEVERVIGFKNKEYLQLKIDDLNG